MCIHKIIFKNHIMYYNLFNCCIFDYKRLFIKIIRMFMVSKFIYYLHLNNFLIFSIIS